jgi:PST family polysaccharide transporter
MTALYSFGFHSLLAQLLYYVAYNIDSYIIGIRWGASALGIYNRAFQMFTVPASQLLAPLTNVALPLMSQRRHNGDDFYPLLWKAQIAISAMLTLVFALAAALARPIVEIALGSAWIQSASVLSILSVGGAVQVLGNMAFWAFLASGNARQLFFSGLVTKPLQALCVGVGSFAGLEGVACGFSVGLTIAWFVSLAWLKRCDSMPVAMFLRSGIYVMFCGVIAGGVGWVLVTLLQARLPMIVLLVGGSVVVLALYIPLLALPRNIRTFLIEIIRPVLARARALAF